MSTTTTPADEAATQNGDDTASIDPAIKVSNLYKVFGRRPKEVVTKLEEGASRDSLTHMGTAAVIDASFEVMPGEIFVVMGLSGSGKSTLIRTLNGLNEPTAGSIKVSGTEVVGLPMPELRDLRREKMSMVFQHFALMPHWTVRENAAYGLEIKGVSKKERAEQADHWLERVGLGGWGDHYPDELSGGMKQRVGLARAFAADTDILLMDEAYSALDPLIRREMQVQLAELQTELNKTVVFITHDLNEAMFLGDRIAVMRDGRIVQQGSPNDILTQPANEYVEKFVQDVDRSKVLTAGDVMDRPKAMVPYTAGPRGALRVMRDLQTSACFVTTNGRRLLGIVRDSEVLDHLKEGGTTLEPVLKPTPSYVKPDQVIGELFELAVETPYSTAVVDENDRLVGVVPRVTLLEAMSDAAAAVSTESEVWEPTADVAQELITEALEAEPGPDGKLTLENDNQEDSK